MSQHEDGLAAKLMGGLRLRGSPDEMASPMANAAGAQGVLRRADVYTVDLPLVEPFEHASSGRIDVLREVVVRLEGDTGVVGWGEVRGNAQYVTGDTQGRLVAVLKEAVLPAILGASFSSPRLIHARMNASIGGNSGAKAAVDLALYDLLGQALGVPVHQLLGGAVRDRIASDASIPFCDPEEAARRAVRYLDAGFRYIKVRVGLEPFQRDLDRVGAIRESIDAHPASSETILAVDTNQGWGVKQAIIRLGILSQFRLGWAEQPIRSADLIGLRNVRESVAVEIMADEACATREDLLAIIKLRAADRCHLKLVKAGGLKPLMDMIALAEVAGMPYMVGQMDEGMLATAGAVQAAAVGTSESGEVWGFQRVGEQPFSGLEVKDGHLVVPTTAGLGVVVDEAGLTRVARLEV